MSHAQRTPRTICRLTLGTHRIELLSYSACITAARRLTGMPVVWSADDPSAEMLDRRTRLAGPSEVATVTETFSTSFPEDHGAETVLDRVHLWRDAVSQSQNDTPIGTIELVTHDSPQNHS